MENIRNHFLQLFLFQSWISFIYDYSDSTSKVRYVLFLWFLSIHHFPVTPWFDSSTTFTRPDATRNTSIIKYMINVF